MKIIFLLTCLLFTGIGRSQILNVSSGTDLTILSGTIFRAENFTLTPSANFTITNNTLINSATINHGSPNPYISRVYQFANSTNAYSGSVQFNYTDGAELNSIPEGTLTLNIYNGAAWDAYAVTTRDGTNNFVLTNGLSAVNLNELTLANVTAPLPLAWLSFTAIKQNQTVLLQWATAQEQNTRSFAVQHSSNGISWTNIGVLPATGNGGNHYNFVHNTPVPELNYYRLLQTDIDNRTSYSAIRKLQFTLSDAPFTITGNPVANKVLTIQVNTAAVFALYNTIGKLVWQERLQAGTKYIDVSRFAKGAYLLKANATVQKVVIP